MKVFEVEFSLISHNKKNGLVEVNTKEELIVYCLDGIIKILDLQLSGKKRMKTKDFLKGNRLGSSFIVK